MQILSKFFHNKHNTLDGTTYDQHHSDAVGTWWCSKPCDFVA